MDNPDEDDTLTDGGTKPTTGTSAVVLVVAAENAETHAANLEQEFGQVIIKRTVREALSLVSSREVDCIISDYELSDGNGIELLEAVRTDYPSLPVILWTESGSEAIASEAIAADVTDYIPKQGRDAVDDDLLLNRTRNAVTEYQSSSMISAGGDVRHLFTNICNGCIGEDTRAAEFRMVLQEVCNATPWKYGEAWVPDATQTALRNTVSYGDGDQFNEFIEISKSMTFKPNEGLPGRVWESETSEWIPDVSLLPTSQYRRASIATQVGLKTGVGIPVVVDDTIEAVLVFYATERRKAETRYRCIVETVSVLLSTHLEQKQSETGSMRKGERTLQERTKELRTIHGAVELFKSTNRSIDELLDEFIRLIPSGFQYPDSTVARITYGTNETTTANFETTEQLLTAQNETQDGTSIKLEVGHLDERNGADIEPFLTEEQELIDTLLTIVTRYYERETVVHQLERSEARYRTLTEDVLDTLDVGVFILNDAFEIEWVNSAVEEYFALDRDEIIGLDKQRLLRDRVADKFEDAEEFEQQVLASYDDNTHIQRFECHILRGDGRKERWLDHWSKPITSGLYEGGRIEQYTDITEKKERERTLERQRELLRHTEEIAQTGGWEADLETGNQRWTEGTRAIHEVSSEFEPTIKTGIDFFHPDDRNTIQDMVDQCADAGESYDVELRLITADDRVRWVRSTGVPVRENGEITKIRGAIQDITERKERSQELEQVHGLLNRAERVADVGGWELDPETRRIFWTDHVFDLLGVTYEDEPPLEQCLNIYYEDDRPIVENAIETALETGDSFDVEVRFRRPDGDIRWLRVQGIPTITDDEVVVLRGAIQDTTARKERERELDSARKRYQTLIEAAPDPIFVADAETGEIIETNTAAAELRQQSDEEIQGLHQTELHPESTMERYRKLFEHHVEHDVTSRQFDDGSPIHMVTADGEQIPVSISSATIELDERTLIHGIFRDISEQRSYEESLKVANEAARQLLEADTDTEIAQTVVDIASDVLDISGIGIFLYDGLAEELVPVAYSDALIDILGELPRFAPGEGIAWRVFIDQEPANFEDVRTVKDVYNPGTPIRRELIYPLGDHGVLIVGDTEVGKFRDLTLELVAIFTANAQAALNRAKRTRELRERERDARLQATKLERIEQLNEEIRTTIKAVIQASTSDSIKQIVCDALCSLDHFDSVWIGEPNVATDEVTIVTTAGTPKDYLNAVSLDLSTDSTLPAVRALRDRKPVVEPNIAEQPSTDDWRNSALLHQHRSIISVPIIFEDVLYGALTIYSKQTGNFDELTKDVLTELGELIGYALNSINQRKALLEEDVVNLTFKISNTEDVFIGLAKELATTLRIKNISKKSENSHLIHFSVDEVGEEQLKATIQDVVGIENVTVVSESEPRLFEVTVVGECIVTKVATLGVHIQLVTVGKDGCELHVSIPQNQDIQTFTRYITDQYSDITLTSQQDGKSDSRNAWIRVLRDNLTERQQDILVTAYYNGYFDRTRTRTGSEIAESFGISQPAFSKQLRVAQYKLLTAILES